MCLGDPYGSNGKVFGGKSAWEIFRIKFFICFLRTRWLHRLGWGVSFDFDIIFLLRIILIPKSVYIKIFIWTSNRHETEPKLLIDFFLIYATMKFPWPPRSCDLTPSYFFLRGSLKENVSADNPHIQDYRDIIYGEIFYFAVHSWRDEKALWG